MTTIATCQKVLPACSESPAPSRLCESDDVNKLVIPGALEELDPDDYPSGLFWTQASWNIHKKNQVNQGINPFNLGFICDEDGTRVLKDCLMAMTKRAKQLWTSCYHLCMDPPTWTKKCDDAALFFCTTCTFLFLKFHCVRMTGKQRLLLLSTTQTGLLMYKAQEPLYISLLLIPFFFSTVFALFQVKDHQKESERTTTKENLAQKTEDSRHHHQH